MEKRIEITIVIGTLNRPNVVVPLLDQLVENAEKIRIEVVVIDQSLPEQYSLLKNQFPKHNNFSLVHFDAPNTCKYLNYGWKNAKAPIVLYLDDDVTITANTIQAHIDAYVNEKVHAVAGRVINDGEQTTIDKRVGKVLWYGAEFTKNFSYEKSTYVDFLYGCNMSFRKETLSEMNGFDENLLPPIYSFNEVDMGYRISKKWKNAIPFSPQALVYHHQYKRGGTRNDFELQEVSRSNNFNYGYFLGKNFTIIENVICFLRRMPYQFIREPSAIPSIIKGYLSSHATRIKSKRMK